MLVDIGLVTGFCAEDTQARKRVRGLFGELEEVCPDAVAGLVSAVDLADVECRECLAVLVEREKEMRALFHRQQKLSGIYEEYSRRAAKVLEGLSVQEDRIRSLALIPESQNLDDIFSQLNDVEARLRELDNHVISLRSIHDEFREHFVEVVPFEVWGCCLLDHYGTRILPRRSVIFSGCCRLSMVVLGFAILFFFVFLSALHFGTLLVLELRSHQCVFDT